jgi:hypothetical protein
MSWSPVPLTVLVDGFNKACGRFDAASSDVDQFHALVEALTWVGAIRDRLQGSGQAVPPVLEGLYYVRNIVLHQGVDVIERVVTGGGAFAASAFDTAAFGGSSVVRSAPIWPPRTAMPAPRSKAGLAEYDAVVEGEAVSDVLSKLAAAL